MPAARKVVFPALLAMAVALLVWVAVRWQSRAYTPDQLTGLIAAHLPRANVPGFRLNYPPLPRRYPGTILDSQAEHPLKSVDTAGTGFNREDFGAVYINLSQKLSAEATARIPFFDLSSDDVRQVELALAFDHGRTVERDISEMKRFAISYLPDSAASDTNRIILRSYEAQLRLLVRRKSSTNHATWVSIRQRVAKAVGRRSGAGLRLAEAQGDSILILGAGRQVLGFVSHNVCVHFCRGRSRSAPDTPTSTRPPAPPVLPNPRGDSKPSIPRPVTETATPISREAPSEIPPEIHDRAAERFDSVTFTLAEGVTGIEAKLNGTPIRHVNILRGQEAVYAVFYFPYVTGRHQISVAYRDVQGAARVCAPESFSSTGPGRHFNCEDL